MKSTTRMVSRQTVPARHKGSILIVTSTFPRWQSDTEPRFVFDLARYYIQAGFEVDVIAPHTPGAEYYEEMEGISVYRYRYFIVRFQTLTYNGGILANLKKNRFNFCLIPFLFLFQIIAVYRKIRSHRYSVIHAHWLIPQGFVCALVTRFTDARKTPVLCTSHGSDLYALNGRVMQRIKQWTAANCRHLCVVSKAMQSECVNMQFRQEGISVLPMGVDLKDLFCPRPSVARKPGRIIFVGRFVENKGIAVLVAAMAKVTSTVSDVELILVGDGPLVPEIRDLIRLHNLQKRILLHGSEDHSRLPDLYCSAEIAVVPSIITRSGDREGFGLVIIEALGCECAVVASALEPIKEIIDDGVTGLLFKEGNSEELAQALIKLLKNESLRTAIAKAGRNKVRQRFDWSTVSEKYCELIESIC